MRSFYTNRNLSNLYLNWLNENGYKYASNAETADLLLLKTNGLYKTLKKLEESKASAIVGFPYSFQLAAKNLLWQNLFKNLGETRIGEFCPKTILINDFYREEKIRDELKKGHKLIFKSNMQHRQGLKIIADLTALENIVIDDFVVAQRLIPTYKIQDHIFNLRLYLSVSFTNGNLEFNLYPVGKLVYANGKNPVTDNKHYKPSLPLLSNNNLFTKAMPADWWTKTEALVNTITTYYKPIFIQLLKPNVSYFDLFGADIIFNDSGNPLILEFNRSPSLTSTLESDAELKQKVLYGFLEKCDEAITKN